MCQYTSHRTPQHYDPCVEPCVRVWWYNLIRRRPFQIFSDISCKFLGKHILRSQHSACQDCHPQLECSRHLGASWAVPPLALPRELRKPRFGEQIDGDMQSKSVFTSNPTQRLSRLSSSAGMQPTSRTTMVGEAMAAEISIAM